MQVLTLSLAIHDEPIQAGSLYLKAGFAMCSLRPHIKDFVRKTGGNRISQKQINASGYESLFMEKRIPWN